jgi:hypothetical protein
MLEAKDLIRRRLAEAKTFLAREAPPRLSESDTKANFIEPIIAALGWQGIGVVTREYYVRNSQEFIDYVMAGPAGPLLAIEAKPLQTDLTDKHAAQLIQYCAVEGIEWAALTNGRELQFFNSFLKPDLAAKRVLRLDLLAFNSDAEFDALFSQIWQLSRESMTTPSGVRTWLNQRRLDSALRALLLDASSTTNRHLRKVLADAEISVGPQDLAQWFRSHLAAPITMLPSAQDRSGPRGSGTSGRDSVKDASSLSRATGQGQEAHDGDDRERAETETPGHVLLEALQRAVNHRFPDTQWRLTKYYTAAEAAGHTFLAVRTRRERLILGLSLPHRAEGSRLAENTGQFNWSRITKWTDIVDESGIDDDLLSLLEAARFNAVGETARKAHYGVTLRDLVQQRLLDPGTELRLIGQGNRELARAHLTANGQIEWNGTSYASPSDRVFAGLLGRKSFNGWTHWHVELPGGRVPLAAMRAQSLEAMRQSVDVDTPALGARASTG